jgi:hypothetical protein
MLDCVSMVAMLLASPKDRIDDESAPRHLERLEPFDLLVGGLDSVPPVGLIVVHDHRIDTQFDQLRLGELQAPEEQLLEQPAEQPYTKPGESFEETLDRMGRKHSFHIRFNGGCITSIFLQGIEVDDVSAGPIEEKAEKLLEYLDQRLALIALSNATKQALQMRIQLDILQIAHKKAQPSTGSENVGCSLNCINLTFAFTAFAAHNDLLPFGFVLDQKMIGKSPFDSAI